MTEWLWILAGASALAGPAEVAHQRLAPTTAAGDLWLDVVPHGGAAGANGLGPRGATVRVQRRIEGLDVDGAGAVWFRPNGTVLYERGLPHDGLPVRSGPHVPVDRAEARAREVVAGTPMGSRLSWQAVGGALRKVWTVPLRHAPGGRFTVPVVRVDAQTGGVLSVEEGADHLDAVANLYRTNPVVDPSPVEVSFELPGAPLADDRLELRQCRDLQDIVIYTIDNLPWVYHVCTEVPALEAKDGDHRYEPVPYPEDPGRDEDDFAPPHLYWHVSLGLDWFEERGWVPRDDWDPYLEVVANQRDSDELTVESAGNPTLPLYPYDNAYFTGAYFDSDKNWVAPRLVFGQGRETDYAYDADVVYHELGHFIVRSRGGPRSTGANGYGLRVEGGALNEGLADYFSSAILGEGVLAEYAGGRDRDYIRTLDGDARCDTDIFGQVHADSQPFAQGLWAFRTSLPPDDARILDEVVIDSLTAIGERTSFSTAYDVLTVAVEDRLGAAAGAALTAEWDARQLDACVPLQRVPVDSDDPVRRFTLLPYFSEFAYDNLVPGYLQFVIDVPSPGTTVTLRGSQSEFLGIDPYGTNAPQDLLVIGGPGERIVWDAEEVTDTTTYNGYELSVDRIRWTPDQELLGDFVAVGTRPHDDQPERTRWHDYELTFEVAEAGPFVFQFAHDDDGYAPVVYNVRVEVEGPGGTGDTGLGADTATAPTSPGSGPSRPTEGEAKGGCGCVGAPDGSLGWLPVVAVLALARRRAVPA